MRYLTTLMCLIFFAQCNSDEQNKSVQSNIVRVHSDRLDWIKIKDNERIDDYFKKDGKVFCGEVQYNDYPMKEVDYESFSIYPSSKYAKDRNNVYYPISIICQDGTDFGVCFCSEYVIKNANPKTFMYLGKDYAKDAKYVYFRGVKIDSADSRTFQVIQGPTNFYFAKDKSNLYMHENIWREGDPETLRFDELNRLNDTFICRYILIDKNHTWEFIAPNSISKLK